VLAGHAYGGAVIAETRDPKVASLVYIAGLAPEEGETVSDVFYRGQPHPKAPELKPDPHRLVWLPDEAFADAFAPKASPEEQACTASEPGTRALSGGPSWRGCGAAVRRVGPGLPGRAARCGGRR